MTQSDVDTGAIDNTAEATGKPPQGDPVTSGPSRAKVTVRGKPGLSLVKSADPADAGHFAVGQTVTYSFVVTNTGNVTLNPVTIREVSFTGSGDEPVPVCPDGALVPGQRVTCTATYRVTQSDVDSGSIENTAVASGTPPGGGAPVDSNPATAKVRAIGGGVATPTVPGLPPEPGQGPGELPNTGVGVGWQLSLAGLLLIAGLTLCLLSRRPRDVDRW